MQIHIEQLLTEKQAADFLNISPETLKKARLKKAGPDYVKVGRSIRYRMSGLIHYLECNTITHERGV